ncbi:hypothetical protein Adu01nite_18760 [Paractinoplanes durhamensis]|uniref:DUF11 domain-containing protein n=1 Tax=Paractinoplanes durhamensis TaxID=113563 RepID=A0ABQ3YSG0_9ACTN|nr:hypothetical protein Adu01nite_18760 [Actinoplanes durhamensis]
MNAVARRRRGRGRRLAVLALAAIALGMLMLPAAAPAAGSIATSAQGLRAALTVLGGQNAVTTTPATWSTGAADTKSVATADVPGVTNLGAVSVTAGPSGDGGSASADVANLDLLSSLSAGAIHSECTMTPTQVAGASSVAGLAVGSGAPTTVSAQTTIGVTGLLTAGVNTQKATWDSGTGLLTYTVRALDVDLLSNSALKTVASSRIVVAESVCTGKVRLGAVRTTSVLLAPGQSGTPTVSVANLGDAAAPNTVVTVPLPPAGYQLGTLKSSNGGTCTKDSTKVTCSGITVPAGASATVSLPVTLSSAATSAPAWSPSSGIDAISTPVAADPGTTIESHGSGTLATPSGAGADVNLAGGVSIRPATITPGGTQATASVKVANSGTSNATPTTITIPAPPALYTLDSVTTTGGGTCTVSGAITCTGVTVPAGGSIVVSIPVTVAAGALTGWLADSSAPVTATAGTSTGTATGPLVTIGSGLTVTVTGPVDGTLSPGDTGELTVTATNGGISDLTGVHYAFLAPTSTTFVGTIPSYCTLTSSTRVDCTMSVTGLSFLQFPLPIKVDAGADPDIALTGGCADAGHDGSCDVPPDVEVDDIHLRASLAGITIDADTATVAPGDSGTGTLKIHADTTIALTTVSVPLTTLPTGFKVTAVNGPNNSVCTVTSNRFSCSAVTLPAGADAEIQVTGSVAADVEPGVVWHATDITVIAGMDVVTGSADLIKTATRDAAVTFTVTSPTGSVEPGGATTMTVTGSNAGPSNAVNSTATVDAPANATFGTLTGTVATACTTVTSTQLTCTYSLTAGGTLTWTLPLTVSSSAKQGDKVADGCVTSGGDSACGGSQTVAIPLATHGTLTVGGAVIKPGDTGTATVRLSATADYDDLVLTVPLDDVPSAFSVTAAALGTDSCTVGTASVVCTGVTLQAGTARSLRLSVAVDAELTTDTAWTVKGVTLAPAGDEDDKLTASGVLVSTSASTFTVSVTVGAIDPTAPKPGQTTVLPITVTDNGPGDADPYPVTIRIPDGTTHGTLPSNCVEGSTDRIVTCTVSLKSGESVVIKLPLVIDDGLAADTVITGGCVDQVLSTGKPTFDYTCGGTEDVAIPDFTIGAYDVDLGVTYGGGTVPVAGASRPVVKIPYANGGTAMAADVSFQIEPPTGVWVTKAQIVLDSSAQQSSVARASAARMTGRKLTAADDTSTVDATCAPTADGDDNDVTCSAPDAAAQSGHELWLTLMLGEGVATGTQAMHVSITTTSEDGLSTNNAVDVPLELTAQDADDTDDGTDLPTTGADVARLGMLSAVLVAFGLVLIVGVREKGVREKVVAYAGVRHQSDRKPRHARPAGLGATLRSLGFSPDRATRGRAGSRASAEGSGGASHAAPPSGRAPRPPAHARSEPARRRRSDE